MPSQSRCRCGRVESSPGADVGEVGPVSPAADVRSLPCTARCALRAVVCAEANEPNEPERRRLTIDSLCGCLLFFLLFCLLFFLLFCLLVFACCFVCSTSIRSTPKSIGSSQAFRRRAFLRKCPSAQSPSDVMWRRRPGPMWRRRPRPMWLCRPGPMWRCCQDRPRSSRRSRRLSL